MYNAENRNFANAAPDCAAVQKCFHALDSFSDWPIGRCLVSEKDGRLSIYGTRDRENRRYLLYAAPLRSWDVEEPILRHIQWVNQSVMSASPYFHALGPVIQESCWFRSGPFFFSVIPEETLRPALEAIGDVSPSSRIMHAVRLAATLRFLQLYRPDNGEQCREKARSAFLRRSVSLFSKAEERLHGLTGISERWAAYYRRNARCLAETHDFTPVMSVGRFLPECLGYCVRRRSFFLRGPFYLSAGSPDEDLCRLLFWFRRFEARDRQYLVDFYFNLNVPCRFFTLLSHQHMTWLLMRLVECPKDSREEKAAIRELAVFSDTRDSFRTPVPVWYKSLEMH